MANFGDSPRKDTEKPHESHLGDLTKYLMQLKPPEKFWGSPLLDSDEERDFQQFKSLIDDPNFFSEGETVKALIAKMSPLNSLVPVLEGGLDPCNGEKDEKSDSRLTKSWAEYLRYIELVFVSNGQKLTKTVTSLATNDVHSVLKDLPDNPPEAPYPYDWAIRDCLAESALKKILKRSVSQDLYVSSSSRLRERRRLEPILPSAGRLSISPRKSTGGGALAESQQKLASILTSRYHDNHKVWKAIANELDNHVDEEEEHSIQRKGASEILCSFALNLIRLLLFEQSCDSLEEIFQVPHSQTHLLCTFDDGKKLRIRKVPKHAVAALLYHRSYVLYPANANGKRDVMYAIRLRPATEEDKDPSKIIGIDGVKLVIPIGDVTKGPWCHLCRTRGKEKLAVCMRTAHEWFEPDPNPTVRVSEIHKRSHIYCFRRYCTDCLKIFNQKQPDENHPERYSCPACERICTGERCQRLNQIIHVQSLYLSRGGDPKLISSMDSVLPGEEVAWEDFIAAKYDSVYSAMRYFEPNETTKSMKSTRTQSPPNTRRSSDHTSALIRNICAMNCMGKNSIVSSQLVPLGEAMQKVYRLNASRLSEVEENLAKSISSRQAFMNKKKEVEDEISKVIAETLPEPESLFKGFSFALSYSCRTMDQYDVKYESLVSGTSTREEPSELKKLSLSQFLTQVEDSDTDDARMSLEDRTVKRRRTNRKWASSAYPRLETIFFTPSTRNKSSKCGGPGGVAQGKGQTCPRIRDVQTDIEDNTETWDMNEIRAAGVSPTGRRSRNVRDAGGTCALANESVFRDEEKKPAPSYFHGAVLKRLQSPSRRHSYMRSTPRFSGVRPKSAMSMPLKRQASQFS